MSRHDKHHQGLRGEINALKAEVKNLAAEFKTLFTEARHAPAVKAAVTEAQETARSIQQVLKNAQQDIKTVFQAAGGQVKKIFGDAAERLAAVNADDAILQTAESAEDAPRIVCGKGAEDSMPFVEAQLAGVHGADAVEPLHG